MKDAQERWFAICPEGFEEKIEALKVGKLKNNSAEEQKPHQIETKPL